jgi:leucyl/phenylalanyl-tRNA--protein transferase
VAGIGADLEPGTLLAAYRNGLFPMRLEEGGPIAWWSPNPRGILPLDGLRMSRSLRRSISRFPVTVDRAFGRVIQGCAAMPRPGKWIDARFVSAYQRLHELGWAHSVEVWSGDPGDDLVGGLYGVAVGGLFAGESMFHRISDASKVALAQLVTRLRDGGGVLLDVQWSTKHLASLGAISISRDEYAARLATAVARPQLTL